MLSRSREPRYSGYLADPFLLQTSEGFIAYGTDPTAGPDAREFEAATSVDLCSWESVGRVLDRPGTDVGTDFWAPEVVRAAGGHWMYYSAGHGISHHHLRVAWAAPASGTFVDLGVDLTPGERFAIDAHPFLDVDGTRYLFFARDVLEGARPGTHIAAAVMTGMTTLDSDIVDILAPNADWQIYQRDRSMYGDDYDWHTLEGPCVVRHDDTYYLFFSGGSWEGEGYGTSYATAPGPLGPWTHAGGDAAALLNTASTGLTGPGHVSVLSLGPDDHVIAYHAWDETMAKRQMFIDRLVFEGGVPSCRPLSP